MDTFDDFWFLFNPAAFLITAATAISYQINLFQRLIRIYSVPEACSKENCFANILSEVEIVITGEQAVSRISVD